MNNFSKVIITVVLFSFYMTAFSQYQGYTLVWEDCFDGNSINEKNWTAIKSDSDNGNKELQYYLSENITVGREPLSGAGCMIITAKKQQKGIKSCTSGKLTSKGKITAQYGIIEARIKMPKTANGLWPAFWMLGVDYPEAKWPKCGEISIVEMGHNFAFKDSVQDKGYLGAIHWGESWEEYQNIIKQRVNSTSLQDDFHLWTLCWDKDSIKFYLDNDKYSNNGPYFSEKIGGDNIINTPSHYFHHPFFICFTLAIGGNFSKIYDVNEISALKNGEAKMYVDYVRIYQKKEF